MPGRPADLPTSFKPQLATLVDGLPPHADDWLRTEVRRLPLSLVRIEGDEVKPTPANGLRQSAKLPHIVQCSCQAAQMGMGGWRSRRAERAGVPNFQARANAFDNDRTGDIVFYAFDLPFIGCRDLREELTVCAANCWRN